MVLKIIRSLSSSTERRAAPRVPEEHAIATIDEVIYPLLNWNITGILIGQYEGQYNVGRPFNVAITIPFLGNDFKFTSSARVVRREKKSRQMAAKLIDLDDQTINKLLSIARAKVWV